MNYFFASKYLQAGVSSGLSMPGRFQALGRAEPAGTCPRLQWLCCHIRAPLCPLIRRFTRSLANECQGKGKGKICGCSWSKQHSKHSYQDAAGFTRDIYWDFHSWSFIKGRNWWNGSGFFFLFFFFFCIFCIPFTPTNYIFNNQPHTSQMKESSLSNRQRCWIIRNTVLHFCKLLQS